MTDPAIDPTPTPPSEPPPRAWRRRQLQAVAGAGAALDKASGPVPALVAAWIAAVLLAGLQSTQFAALIGLGFAGAFIAGLVGIGGAIVMIPLLLYVPPLLDVPALGIHVVAGITLVQVMAAGITGMLAHRQEGSVESSLVMTLGLGTMLASLAGGLVSGFVSASALMGLFASLAVLAALIMLGGARRRLGEPSVGDLHFNRVTAVALGGVTGFLVGMVGAGGGFLLVPMMIHLLNVPVRIAVGTSLAIVALGGAAGTLGKAMTGQVEWMLALALVTGALPGARIGAVVSRRISAPALARLLGLVVGLIAAKMWWDIIGG